MYAPFKSPAGMYRNVGVETGIEAADPHQLVTMLFDGALAEIATARFEMLRAATAAKCKAISKAARIVDEGLKSTLDPSSGDIARNLSQLYAYIVARLTHANLKNDEAALAECAQLLTKVREGWVGIRVSAVAA